MKQVANPLLHPQICCILLTFSKNQYAKVFKALVTLDSSKAMEIDPKSNSKVATVRCYCVTI